MLPTEHMNPAEDELIAHLRDRLSAHEEDYTPGAWENFNKKEKKRPVIWLWSLSGAAALLVLGLLAFLKGNGDSIPAKAAAEFTIRPQTQKEKYESKEIQAETTSPVNDVIVGQHDAAKVVSNPMQEKPEALDNKQDVLAVIKVPVDNGSNAMPNIIDQQVADVKTKDKITTAQPLKKQSFEDFLAQESAKAPSSKVEGKKTTEKWEVGVMVAPSIGNDKKLNMGYGINMAYALSSKVSISSGLAYNEMGSARDNTNLSQSAPNSPSMAAAFVSTSKELRSVQTRLRGIDIPLEFRYKFSSKVYANAGVSVFAVFKQEQQNTFLQSSVESASSTSLVNEERDAFKQVLVNRVVSEEAPAEEIKNDPYLGFYNFSVGFKQKLSKKNSFAVEPFLKVPMKEISNDNLKLLGTGVKLRFDF